MITSKNKLLTGSAAQIEAQIAPEFRDAYDKIVVSGMKVALNKGLEGMLGGLEKRGDPIRDAAQGAVNLVFMLRMQATGVMPEQAMVPASYVLMLQALAFIEEAGISKIGTEQLTKATHTWTNTIFARSKISPQMLERSASEVRGIMSDPTKMEQLNLVTGYVRDPRAGTPMEMPVAQPPRMNRRQRRAAKRAGGR
jgi:hypothetical protein